MPDLSDADAGTVGAVVLAAGGSVRMGRPKQLLTFEGQTLLRRAAEAAVGAGLHPVVVVLGPEPSRMTQELSGLPVHAVTNEAWQRGIGSSIRTGISELLALAPTCRAAVIVLCDQPLVSAATLRRLVDAGRASGQPVCVSVYGDAFGPPVLVTERFFPDLLALADAQGAKAVWADHPDAVCRVPCDEGAVDVDTPAEYARLVGADAGRGD